MRRCRRIADQYDVLVRPGLAQQALKIEPCRAAQVRGVGDQVVAAELVGEDLLAAGRGLLLAHGGKAKALPGALRALDDEGRGISVELVGVRPNPAVLGFLKDE